MPVPILPVPSLLDSHGNRADDEAYADSGCFGGVRESSALDTKSPKGDRQLENVTIKQITLGKTISRQGAKLEMKTDGFSFAGFAPWREKFVFPQLLNRV